MVDRKTYPAWRCPTPQLSRPLQVNGTGLDQFAGEREYVENFSLSHDLRLIAHTLPAMVRGEGAF